MDAFELLLRASDPDMSLNNDTKDFEQMIKGKPMFDYRDHLKNTMLGKRSSLLLAVRVYRKNVLLLVCNAH